MPLAVAPLRSIGGRHVTVGGPGCLAVSHEKTREGSLPWRRRFDFVFVTRDLEPIKVRYHPIARAQAVGSSHAPVVAEVAPRRN
jgi:endonuclease/exonuclease/phosphatase family metal-dependent hydrolase